MVLSLGRDDDWKEVFELSRYLGRWVTCESTRQGRWYFGYLRRTRVFGTVQLLGLLCFRFGCVASPRVCTPTWPVARLP